MRLFTRYVRRCVWAAVCLIGISPQVTTAVAQPLLRASEQPNALFGNSVASAGDVNRDGFDDVLVGAPYYDSPTTDSGAAYLYLGSAAGISSSPSWMAMGENSQEYFGTSVASAGDVNGDGFADVVVGAPYAGPNFEGKTYLFFGGPTGLSSTPASAITGASKMALCGSSVASAGDINKDGYGDVIIGSPDFSGTELSEGEAAIYLGGPSGLNSSPFWTYHSSAKDALFGYSVASAGDINGDGYIDIVVGALQEKIAGYGAGRAYLFLGSASGVSASPDWTYEDTAMYGQLGVSVASAGDLNGDGFDDIVIGEHAYGGGSGKAYLFSGSPSGLPQTPTWSVTTTSPAAQLGFSVAPAGDVNGDGLPDLAIGARGFQYNGSRTGLAMVFLGDVHGLSRTPDWWAVGGNDLPGFGLSVASAGDTNRDGKADLVVGAPFATINTIAGGASYIFLGNATSIFQGPPPPPLGGYLPGITPTPAPTATLTSSQTPIPTPTPTGSLTPTPTTPSVTPTAASTPTAPSTGSINIQADPLLSSACASTFSTVTTRGQVNARMVGCSSKTAARFRGQWALKTTTARGFAVTQCSATGQQALTSLALRAVSIATTDNCSWKKKPRISVAWKTGVRPRVTLRGMNGKCAKKVKGASVRRAKIVSLDGSKSARVTGQMRVRLDNCAGWGRWEKLNVITAW